jgi:hypothetical protein
MLAGLDAGRLVAQNYQMPLGVPGFTYGASAAMMGGYPPGAAYPYGPFGQPGGQPAEPPGYASTDDGSGPDASCPRLFVSAGAVILHRSFAPHEALATDPFLGETALDAHTLNQRWAVGPRIDATWCLNDQWAVEGLFFGVNDWDSHGASASSASGLFVPGLSKEFLFQDMTARCFSNLYSNELNLRDELGPNITLLGGFRWLQLGDRLTMSGDSTISPNQGTAMTTAITTNNLYGFQVGADLTLGEADRGLCFKGYVKGGIYGNDVDLKQTTTGTGVFSDSYFTASRGQASFVGEVAFLPQYKLTEHLSIFGGYQALWLEAVALAPPQLGSSGTPIHASRTVFYNGGVAGLEARW